jgi:hypothetical protein
LIAKEPKLIILVTPTLLSVIERGEIKVEVPKELEMGAKMLGEEELCRIVCEALKEQLSEELMFKLADELLKESKLTDELALKLSDELKERVAKKHGL